MRAPPTRIVRDLPPPDPEVLEAARRVTERRPEEHGRFLTQVEALHLVEQGEPERRLSWPRRFTLASFNAERLKRPGAVRALLDRAGAQAALLSEVDVGMARSGNRHGPRDLAGAAGEGFVYGVEYVELDLGDPREMREHRGGRNERGFHGNAIVTGLRLVEPHVIPLEEDGAWFSGRDGAQHRIGGRIAVAARVADAPAPFWLVAVHLESKTDAADRARQMRRLLVELDRIAAGAAVVIGGDLNTKALPPDEPERWLVDPARWEPLFADVAAAGFDWRAANLARATQRTGPASKPQAPFGKLDWILTRGVEAKNPRVIAALDGEGQPISDHEMLAVDLALEDRAAAR